MKITKRQLKRIIAEEKQKLNESSTFDVMQEFEVLINELGPAAFSKALVDSLGDEATSRGARMAAWIRGVYGVDYVPPIIIHPLIPSHISVTAMKLLFITKVDMPSIVSLPAASSVML